MNFTHTKTAFITSLFNSRITNRTQRR